MPHNCACGGRYQHFYRVPKTGPGLYHMFRCDKCGRFAKQRVRKAKS